MYCAHELVGDSRICARCGEYVMEPERARECVARARAVLARHPRRLDPFTESIEDVRSGA